MKSIAYERGFMHAINGLSPLDCPFAGDTVGSEKLRKRWLAGFDAGVARRLVRERLSLRRSRYVDDRLQQISGGRDDQPN